MTRTLSPEAFIQACQVCRPTKHLHGWDARDIGEMVAALRDSRDKWAETARKLGEQLDASERDAERLSALLDDCRDHIMSQYDPEDSVKLVRRIEEALGLGEPV